MKEYDLDAFRKQQGIIDSMTPAERRNPALIDIARRRRIAVGSGVETSDVAGLVKQFHQMAAVIKSMDGRRKYL